MDLTILLLPLLAILFTCYLIQRRLGSSRHPLIPPGPNPWPVLGNILQMGDQPHVTLARFAREYGPIFSLRFGSQLVVVGSSKEAAAEILKTQDRLLSGRYVPDMVASKSPELNKLSLVWHVDCSDEWKRLRVLCRAELFSGKALESQARLREEEIIKMTQFIRRMEGKVVKIREAVFAASFNFLGNLLLSRDMVNLEEESKEGGFSGPLRKCFEAVAAPNVSDMFPSLARFDLQGLKRKNQEFFRKTFQMWEPIIKEKREKRLRKGEEAKEGDFLDTLIETGSSNDQINMILLELFSGGTESTSSTTEWLLTELIKNPKHLKRVQEEITAHIGHDMVKQCHVSSFTYLEACHKETLRLHPPAPLLVPHRAIDECQVMNYTIPKDTQVLVNAWAIGRDPEYWEDPLVFNPERFVNSSIDLKGNDFELIPFGAGRRICPGVQMIGKHVPLILASLVHCFDWSLPEGLVPENLDTSEKYGLTMMKKEPLLLIPKAKKY